jgi:hypothetical protein
VKTSGKKNKHQILGTKKSKTGNGGKKLADNATNSLLHTHIFQSEQPFIVREGAWK